MMKIVVTYSVMKLNTNNMKYTIKYTGKTMGELNIRNSYGDYCPGTMNAHQVVKDSGDVVFVGTYEACFNYLSIP